MATTPRADSKPESKDVLDATSGADATAAEAAAVVEKEIVLESQLNLAVDVLTSKACTEEGLEDCTNLLLHISRVNPATR